jgi:hypothetical protein
MWQGIVPQALRAGYTPLAYAVQILLFGAEFTQVYWNTYGNRLSRGSMR